MSLTVETIKLKSDNINGESLFPSISVMSNIQQLNQSFLKEDSGVFIRYGFLSCIFPYKMQDKYDRACIQKEYKAIVLENEYLKAVFLPELGGRLWSLFDKKNNKDLLYTNTMVRPCNFALRNAWFAGGIEYNCGMVGHSPFTCDTMFTAITKLDDGTPVLRMYQYERIRNCVYQMDFFLPDNSPLLYARMRIVNTLFHTIPMYWWTNIALPKGEEYRNIVNCESAFVSKLMPNGRAVDTISVPNADKEDISQGKDVSYPINTLTSRDYFWNVSDDKRKFTCYVDKTGYGFIQTSTSRLKGRKLFTFGTLKGSSNRERSLTSDDNPSPSYVELQAGLARTQYECIPMPPKNAWEWIEVYGAIQVDKQKAHGEWRDAINEVETELDRIITQEQLEKTLKDTYKMATTRADKVLIYANGWATLENMRRERFGQETMCQHLDFGKISSEQQVWVDLLDNGSFSKDISINPPESWMNQKEWTEIIEKSKNTYLKYLHLTCIYFANDNIEYALRNLKKLSKYKATPVSLFVKAQILNNLGEEVKAGKTLLKAHKMFRNDLSLAREAFKIASNAGLHKDVYNEYHKLPDNIKNDGRINMYYIKAVLNLQGDEKAYELLIKDGGVAVFDIREGELSLNALYLAIIEAKYKREGKPFNPNEIKIPAQFDYSTKINYKK